MENVKKHQIVPKPVKFHQDNFLTQGFSGAMGFPKTYPKGVCQNNAFG
jgi:hypothetical protein